MKGDKWQIPRGAGSRLGHRERNSPAGFTIHVHIPTILAEQQFLNTDSFASIQNKLCPQTSLPEYAVSFRSPFYASLIFPSLLYIIPSSPSLNIIHEYSTDLFLFNITQARVIFVDGNTVKNMFLQFQSQQMCLPKLRFQSEILHECTTCTVVCPYHMYCSISGGLFLKQSLWGSPCLSAAIVSRVEGNQMSSISTGNWLVQQFSLQCNLKSLSLQ